MLICPYCRERALQEMRGFGLVCANCTYTHRNGTSFTHEDIAIIWPKLTPDHDADDLDGILFAYKALAMALTAEVIRLRGLPTQIQGQLNWLLHKVIELEEHLESIPRGKRRKYVRLAETESE